MHFDECFSYFNTNNSVGRLAYDRTYVSSYDIMKDFYVLDGEGFNYPYVVLLQSYDVHPPVFYIFLHTLCSFMPGVFSMWQGVALNILYALITTVFIYLTVNEITKNIYVSYFISGLVAVNTGVICNVMYIRMYALMALWISICVYLHVRMARYENFNDIPIKYPIIGFVLTFLGFLTHYFYLVFLFFIEAAFFIPKLFRFKNNFKGIIKYGLFILAAGILGVAVYPSCLGHVHSGYRGQEVTSYLLDASDIFTRFEFFGGLINKYVFNNTMYIFILLCVLMLVTAFSKSHKDKKMNTNDVEDYRVRALIECIIIPTLGYFIISSKCSLLGDEAMMRYQLPIYSLIIVSIAVTIYECVNYVIKNKKAAFWINTCLGTVFLIISIVGVLKGNVFYLYPEQERMEEIAAEHSNDPCLYIYNNESSKYLLWNDFMQLAKYNEVYFVNSEDLTPIDDAKINNAESLVVYTSIMGELDFEKYKSFVLESDTNVTNATKLYDGMYAKAYYFE